MNKSKAVFVTKRDIKRNTFIKDSGLHSVNVIAARTPKKQKKYEEEPNIEVESQCEKKRRNLKNKKRYSRITENSGYTQYCHQVLCDNLAINHSSEVKVGQIRTIKRKKIKKIYLPEIVDNGVGSFDLSTIKKRRHRKVTASKCVGAIFECTTGNSKSKEKTHLAATNSMGTGPSVPRTLIIVHQKGRHRDKKCVEDTTQSTAAENVTKKSKGDNVTHIESSSILPDIHDFLVANNIPTGEVKCNLIDQVSQVPIECSKSSKRKIKSCLKSNEITKFKSSSSLRQKYEKLMTGDSVKKVSNEKIMRDDLKGDGLDNISKQSNINMLNNKSITSIHEKPSFSDFDPNIVSQDGPFYKDENASPFYNDGIKGMFKLWSRRFNLDDDYNRQNPTSSFDLSYTDKRLDSQQSQKKETKFFIFKRRTKSKSNSYKSNKPVITGMCQAKTGVMIKVEPSKPTSFSYSSSKKALKRNIHSAQNWIQAFKSKEYDSRRSVHIRWCNDNKTFSRSSSTVFKLMNDVYHNPETIFPSKSELIRKGISHGPIKSPVAPRSSFANRNYDAWMIHEAIFNTQRPTHTRSNKSELLNKKRNVQIKVTNKQCFIEKSKAFSHRIEVVLHSKNIIKSQNKDVSDEFIKIDIPKGFFNESSSDTKLYGYSDEEVYNIINYEMSSIDMDSQKKPEKEKLNYSTGDHKSCNNQDIAKQKSEIFSRQPTNNEIFIPKKVDVVGVGIISKGIEDFVRKPMCKPSNETLCNNSQVSLKRVENKFEFTESYIRDYYKNWMPLSLDLYSWCVDMSKVKSKNSQNCEQGSIAEHDSSSSKSCPTICGDLNDSTEIITTSLNNLSSNEHTINPELQNVGEKKYQFNLLKKIKTWTVSKVNPEPLKRAVPKDSLEVTKQRKVYARIKESANMNKCCNGSQIKFILDNNNCEGKKRVFVYDHERNTFVPPGLLKCKTSEPNCDSSCPKSLENAIRSGSNCTVLNFQRVTKRRIPYTGSKNNLLNGSSSSCNNYSPISPRYSRDAFKSPNPRRRPPHQPPSPMIRRSPHRSPTSPSPPLYRRSPMRPATKVCDDGSPIYRRQYAGGSPDSRSPHRSSKCETPQHIGSNSKQSLDGALGKKCDLSLGRGNSYVLNRRSQPRSPPYANRRLKDDCHSPGTGVNSHSSLNRSSPLHHIAPYRVPLRMPPKCPSPIPCPLPLLIKESSTIEQKSSPYALKSGSREALRLAADQRQSINTSSCATEFKPECFHPKCPVSSPIIDIYSIKKLLGTCVETKISPKEVQCGDPLSPSSSLSENNSQCSPLKLIIDASGPLPVLKPPCVDPVCPTKRLAKITNKVEVKCSTPNTHCRVSQCPTKLPNKKIPLADLTVASVLSNATKKAFEGSLSNTSIKQSIYSGDSKFPITSVISKIMKKTMREIGTHKVEVDKSVTTDFHSPCGDPCRTTTLLKVGHTPCCNKTCPKSSASNKNNHLSCLGMTDSDISNIINKDPRFLITCIPSNALANDLSSVDSNTTQKQIPWEDPRCGTKKDAGTKCSNTKCNVPFKQKVNKCQCSRKPSFTNCKYNSEKEISGIDYALPQNQNKGCTCIPICDSSKTIQNPQDRAGVKRTSSKQTFCDDFKFYPPPPAVPRNTVALDRPGSSFNIPRKQGKCVSPPKTKAKKIIQKELGCDGPCVSRFDRPQNMANKNLVSSSASNRTQKELGCDGPCVSRFDRPKNMANKNLVSSSASNRTQKELGCDGPCVSRFDRPQNMANKNLVSSSASNRTQKELGCDGPCVSRFDRPQNMANKNLVSSSASNRTQKELECDGPCVSRFDRSQNMANKRSGTNFPVKRSLNRECNFGPKVLSKSTSNHDPFLKRRLDVSSAKGANQRGSTLSWLAGKLLGGPKCQDQDSALSMSDNVSCDDPKSLKPQIKTMSKVSDAVSCSDPRCLKPQIKAMSKVSDEVPCGDTRCLKPQIKAMSKVSDGVSCGDPRCLKSQIKAMSKASDGVSCGDPRCLKSQIKAMSKVSDNVSCGDPRCLKPQMKTMCKERDDVCCGDPRCLKTQIKAMSKVGGTMCSGTNTISPHSKCVVIETQSEPEPVLECVPEKKRDVESMCTASPRQNKKKFTFPWPFSSKKSNQNTNQPNTWQSPLHQPPKRAIYPLVDDNGRATSRNTIGDSSKPHEQQMCKPPCAENLGGFKLHNSASKPLLTNHRVYICASEILMCDSTKQYKIAKMHSVQNITLNKKISSDKKLFKCKENVKDNSKTINELYNANVNSCKCSFNKECKIKKAEFSKTSLNISESDSNLTNTVEINFKLKFKKGDKATEINFGHDTDKMEKKCRGINKSPEEVYVLRDNVEQSDLKSSRKNDLNIKIIIQNYTPIDKNKIKSYDDKINEFSQNISQKLCTVSTGYGDLLLQDKETIPDNNIDCVVIEPTNISVHKATIDLALSDKSEEIIVKSGGASLGSTKTSLSLKTSQGVNTNSCDTSSSKNEDSAILSVTKSNTIINKIHFEEIIELNQTISHTSISNVVAHHTVSTVNEITEDESNKSKVEMSHSRSLLIQNKKDALKGLGEVIIDKVHNKENVQEFRTMLQAILTSSASNSTTSKDIEKSSSKRMESNKTSMSSAERDGSKKYLSTNSNYSRNTCCPGNKPNGCLCSILATKMNATRKYIDDSQPACCCRKKEKPICKMDEEVNCNIETRVELDFSEFNITTSCKQVVASSESKDSSLQKTSKESDKTSYECLSRNDNYLNDQEDEILNNILDSVTQKRENEIRHISSKSSSNRRYDNEIKKNKLYDADRFGLISSKTSKASDTSMETMFFQKLKRTKHRNNKRIINRNIGGKFDKADLLQSYETKKAVLQIYAEKTMSESHFTAKLPKFMYKEDSLEDCSVQIREITSSQKSYSKIYNIERNVLTVSIER